MSARGRRSRIALGGALIVSTLSLGPLLAFGGTPAAATVNLTETPVRVALASVRPAAPQPGDTLVMHGTLQNLSSGQVSSPDVNLLLGEKITSRGAFDDFAAQPQAAITGPYSTVATVTVPTLAPNASEPFTIRVPVDNFNLPSTWQVNYLEISVTGTTTLNLQTVGSLRTFLPWAPRTAVGSGYPVPVAWVWPLVDRPHRSTGPEWLDDDLAPELATGGRLSGLLAAARSAQEQRPSARHAVTTNVPVTWALDPMLVRDVNSMAAGPYVVAGPPGSSAHTTAGTGTQNARAWLGSLKAALANPHAAVLPLPFADPDVNAAVRSTFSTEIGLASAYGKTLLTQILGTADPTAIQRMLSIGWPPGGFASQRAVNILTASGDRKIVLSDGALPYRDGQPSATPSALTPFTTNDVSANALLTDSVLDDAINDGASHPANQGLDVQRYLAETLMIQNEKPGRARGVVLAPGRHWSPPSAYASTLLADAGKVPWIEPVRINQIQADPIAERPARLPLIYPREARRTELPPSYMSNLNQLHRQVSAFAAVLPTNDPAIVAYTTAEQQSLSAAWRSKPNLATQRLNNLRSQLAVQMSGVRITSQPGSYVTLTSHGGKVPITIANDLDTAVRVSVKLAPSQRLSNAEGGEIKNQVIQAHQVINVDVHAAAKTSGVFPLKVQLYTPDSQHPQKYGPEVQLYVRSTVYGTITLVITGAATAALMIAVAIRLSRRALAARRRATAAT